MSRLLTVFNLLGVLVLCGLSAVQWQQNRVLELHTSELERVRNEQAAKLAEQATQINQQQADLDDFRNRLTLAEGQLKTLTAELSKTTAERDRLQLAVAKWTDAVSQRDAIIKETDGQIQKLVKERNDAVERFNTLAKEYNDAVKSAAK